MTSRFLLLAVSVECCLAVLLSPLENNDKLKHITRPLVAEWQWESWPIKQEPNAPDNQSPGPRINVGLWREPTKSAWYLFGGQPIDSNITKVYSDIWKYSVATRLWQKFFPSIPRMKSQKESGGAIIFRSDLLDEVTASRKQSKNFRVLLCGSVTNVTNQKKPDFWTTFYKRKKPEEETKEVLDSIAVYVPQTSKPNTVWRLDTKNNLWTSYACCCDASDGGNLTFKSIAHKVIKRNQTLENVHVGESLIAAGNESSIFDSNINKLEDEIENTRQYLSIKNVNRKKKINQYKNGAESLSAKFRFRKKRHVEKMKEKTKSEKEEEAYDSGSNENPTKVNNKNKKEKFNIKLREEELKRKRKEDALDRVKNSKMGTKNCQKNTSRDEPVTWCDGRNGVLGVMNVSLTQIVMWTFNLSTNQWSKKAMKLDDKLSLCLNLNTIRYAETGEEVYLFCTPQDKSNNGSESTKSFTDSSDIPQKDEFTRKLVFRINYKKKILDSLGDVRLNPYFGTPEGEAVWLNSTKTVLQAIKYSEKETILVLAYLNVVDLWILTGDSHQNEYFDLTEKIWRGSALKWFDKYNAAFYNLQFVSESGESETILIPNPRAIPASEYWGRERGRFIIRIFKNKNFKNQSFENRTREQNLTYELLQSDQNPSEDEPHLSNTYSFFICFGITLITVKVVVFIIFIKRLIARSRKTKIRGECKKTPLIIRYSVIPDDLLQATT